MPDRATLSETRPAPGSLEQLSVVFDHVSFAFDEQVVLEDVSFSVPRGSMRFLLGASGSGKSVLLKLILGLLRPDRGHIVVNGQRIDAMKEADMLPMRADIGMVFQENALFDSFTVNENVGYRLYEETEMPIDEVRARVADVLGFIGLAEYIDRMPSELSGGQRRRVALARALATRPKLLLFDDYHRTRADGVRIVKTDDPASTRAEFMVLHEGRILFEGHAKELLDAQEADPYLKEFLFKTLPPW
jgi:phospholipid/cholesterol/gamma-HCH transport system ATP-binding protein